LINSKGEKRSIALIFLVILALAPAASLSQTIDVQEIIKKSVAANQADFKEDPNYNYKELDRTPKGSKLYRVMMIEGTPYNRLIAVNGKPLSRAQDAQEEKKMQQTIQQRRSESSEERQKRIAKYQKERNRDNQMMNELTKAFEFTLLGQRKVRGFNVWVLKATPRPGYKPPSIETQVLTGMQGELWIDQKTYQWVKVTAQVVRPVSIEGFLAQVEPGTRFELEKSPVGNGVWQTTHFSMHSNAKILHMFGHASHEDESYFDFQRIGASSQAATESSRR
jgi:hypothetical protein